MTKIIKALIAVCFCVAQVSYAEISIVIKKGVEKPTRVAIVPFGYEGEGVPPINVAEIVSADLARTGLFQPIPEDEMLQKPTQGHQIQFGDWRLQEVEAIVVGNVKREASGNYTISFQLYDILRGDQLVSARVPSSPRGMRAWTHRVADLVYEKLTGVPGAFATRIAYVTASGSGNNRTFKLIVADADGENAIDVTTSKHPLMSPSWSPDGRRLAYVSFEEKKSAIYIQTLSTGQRQKVSELAGVNGSPSWSPDGRRLALTLTREPGNLDVCVLQLSSGRVRRITSSPAIDTEAIWSKDGSELFFTSDRGGGPQVYRVEANGGTPRRVTFTGSYNARPRLSPDGEQLSVVYLDQGKYRIAVLDLDRSRPVPQVLTDGFLDESPSFAPNGATIIYATGGEGRGSLATVSSDGRVQQTIESSEGDVREPVWSPFRRDLVFR